MNRMFFEAFPMLKVDDDIFNDMKSVEIEKISSTKKHDFIRIYIKSSILIEKSTIYKIEKSIQDQLFSGVNVTVKVYEKFTLSSQYTPKYLMDFYSESIFLEFKNYDPIEHTIIKRATFEYPDDSNVNICLEENVITRKKAQDIKRVFEKIFNERCGLNVNFNITYREAVERTKPQYTYDAVHIEKGPEIVEVDAIKVVESRSEKVEKKQDSNWSNEKSKQDIKKGATFAKGKFSKIPDDPSIIYGRNFDEEITQIIDIEGAIGEIVVRGQIIKYERKDIKNEKAILMFAITDFTDSIKVKIFAKQEQVAKLEEKIHVGAFIKLKGIAALDNFDHEVSIQSVVGIKEIPDFTTKRVDNAPRKRVELHCHTKMSDMDAVSSAEDIILQAYKWGMPGIAITDHAVVQGLTEGDHFINHLQIFEFDDDGLSYGDILTSGCIGFRQLAPLVAEYRNLRVTWI